MAGKLWDKCEAEHRENLNSYDIGWNQKTRNIKRKIEQKGKEKHKDTVDNLTVICTNFDLDHQIITQDHQRWGSSWTVINLERFEQREKKRTKKQSSEMGRIVKRLYQQQPFTLSCLCFSVN